MHFMGILKWGKKYDFTDKSLYYIAQSTWKQSTRTLFYDTRYIEGKNNTPVT